MRLIATALLAATICSMPADARTLLIGNKGENSLSFVDLATGREMRRVETGPAPHEIAISPDGATAAVVAYGGRTIELYDLATAERRATIDLEDGARPHGIVWLKDGRIVATAEGVDALFVIVPGNSGKPAKVDRVATGQKGTHMVVVSPDGRRAWVTNMKSASVSMIDLAARRTLRNVPLGKEPEGIALDARRGRLWVADRGGTQVHVLDAKTLAEVARLPTGAMPIRVLLSPDGKRVVVSNAGAGTISEYDAAALKPTRTIAVSGQSASGQVTLLYTADGSRLYAAETGIDRVAEIHVASGRVLGRLAAGRNGDGLGISDLPAPAPIAGSAPRRE